MAGSRPDALELLTVPELARRTGLSERRVRNAVRRGELRAHTVGGVRVRICLRDFADWLDATATAPPSSERP